MKRSDSAETFEGLARPRRKQDCKKQQPAATTAKQLKEQTMKAMKHLLVAAAATLTLTISAQAGEPLLSPKAEALADSLRKVPGTTPDMIDRSVQPGTPKPFEQITDAERSAIIETNK